MRPLLRTAVPMLMVGLTAWRYAGLRGPMLWLALLRGVGLRAAIPVLVVLSAARWLTRPTRQGEAPPGSRSRAGTAARP